MTNRRGCRWHRRGRKWRAERRAARAAGAEHTAELAGRVHLVLHTRPLAAAACTGPGVHHKQSPQKDFTRWTRDKLLHWSCNATTLVQHADAAAMSGCAAGMTQLAPAMWGRRGRARQHAALLTGRGPRQSVPLLYGAGGVRGADP